MRRETLPRGDRWDDPFPVDDLEQAKRIAYTGNMKFWFRIRSDQTHRYEIWPGGRTTAWPLTMLERRRGLQDPLPEGHRCKHAWDTHTDTFICGAGSHTEQWVQCLKCGQIREDRIPIRRFAATESTGESDAPENPA